MNCSLDFVSIGCNRVASCSTWGKNNIFAYAAHKFIALYDPVSNKVTATLKGHTDRVNSIKFIPNRFDVHFGPEDELVSSGVDGNIIVWRASEHSFAIRQTLKEHKQTVTCVSTIANEHDTYIAASSADGSVSVWHREGYDSEFKLEGKLHFGNKMMETVAIAFLPNSTIPVVVTGGLDYVIHVFVKENNTFNKLCTLPGHEDWIRNMEFTSLDETTLLLASASQDYRVRLWKFTERFSDDSLLNMANIGSKKGFSLSKTGHVLKTNDRTYTVIFEALLTGHEEWIHSVNWHPKVKSGDKVVQPLKLLTSSMDRSMMIWSPMEENGIWVDTARMGEFGGLSGLFGQMGYFGGYFSPDGAMVMGHGYHGSFYLWKLENNEWRPHVSISGHSSSVMDISWDTEQNYFVSTSHDQTTRLFSQWIHSEDKSSWHEIGRPQVHGHDLECLAFVQGKKEHVIVTGADEKVLRVFEAPSSFLKSLENISGVKSDTTIERALGASVPALGLSNKPIQVGEADPSVRHEFGAIDEEDDEMPVFNPVELQQPPFEQALMQNTLWPEIQKLYGHPNEMVCVASNHSGTVIASACTAKQADIAAIRLWDTTTWRQLDVLQGHTLTVAQISFSPDDQYMLSVSRDRHVILYERTPLDNQKYTYTPVIKSKASERIIWGCSWSFDSKIAVTGSRDKTVKIWRMDDIEKAKQEYQEYAKLSPLEKKKRNASPFPLVGSLTFNSGVTSCEFVDFHRYNHIIPEQQYIFAVGLEDGNIFICKVKEDLSECTVISEIDTRLTHVEDVKKLRWRQVKTSDDKYCWQLISASTDHSIRLYNITL